MMQKVINIPEKLTLFSEHYSPRIVAQMNNYYFKVAKFQGEFVWHQHESTDETFIVLEGEMEIDFESGSVKLKKGEMLVVPKGVRHRPRAERECSLMLVEPVGTINTGDAGGSLTAEENRWI